MQTTSYRELPQRARYYQDVIDINLIEKGEDYDILKALLNYFDGERPSSRYTKELEKKKNLREQLLMKSIRKN